MNRLLLLASLFLVPAFAGTMAFGDRTMWQTAVASRGLGVVDPFALGSLAMTGDSVVVSGLTGSLGNAIDPGAGTQLVVADRDAFGYDFGIPHVVSAQLGFPSTLTFTFGAGTFGFAFDVGAFPAIGDTTDLKLGIVTAGGTETFDLAGLGGMGTSFVGFTADQAIFSLSVTGGAADPVFGNISVAAVPEPGSALLVLFAGSALLAWRRR